ncbi:Transcription factor GRAS domain-containing protein [Dioscorea alata]|uniref:Transcription factor GRAS domain-containing protein n=1 Tax=Dioscorea alata TaxID=55571 RepID=A0ACB7WRE9_DIOAL|nr:Transcription factor GRAS domain-containing protein [Dioscorea alata]
MKRSFEMHGTLELIHPSEQWDCAPMSFKAARQYTGVDISDFMEHVARQLSENSENTADGFSMESLSNETFTPSNREYHPRKQARTYYNNSDIDGGNAEELQWINGTQSYDNMINMTKNKSGDHHHHHQNDQQGLSLITLLMECAVAISVDNLEEANKMLLELTQIASPYSASCAERVVAYFAKAMARRVMSSCLGGGTIMYSPLLQTKAILSAFQTFNTISPFIKFAHFTANQAILEAFHQRDRVHIIDLDIMQGLQWPALFHILATRPEGPPHVRMTAMGTSYEALEETGRQLSGFARRLGISFEFHPVGRKPGEVDPAMVQTRRGETIAVHWLQHSLYDAIGVNWKTMRLLEMIAPRVITLVEQEMPPHSGQFLERFVGALHYYSTIFDSLGATLGCEDVNRHKVEHWMLEREINNVLAVGGGEEEMFGGWRTELVRRGFAQVPMSGNSMTQAQLILNMFPAMHGYTIQQGDGTLRLGWKETGLYTASVWTSPRLMR